MQSAHAAVNDGRALELAIANHFASHGYQVRRNAVIEGRSGAPHEIDVLAVRRDAVAEVTIAVECKAWQNPVEKAVLSKLDYVLRDCGLNKGIVVSTGGFRAGAEAAAAQLAIDLWGPDELSHLLGAAALLYVQSPTVAREAVGWPFTTNADQAQRRVRSEARGRVVLGRQEKIVGVWACWLPMHVASISVAQAQRKWGRDITVSRPVSNCYDGLTHTYFGGVPTTPTTIDLGQLPTVGELVRPSKVAPMIAKAMDEAMKVTTAAAEARHAQKLTALGVPWPCRGISVERVDATWWPVWVGVLEGRNSRRLVAVDGTTGVVDQRLSALITSAMGHVRDALSDW
jgi:hypothetical protein